MLYNIALLRLKNEEDALDAIQDTILACWENLPLLKSDRYFKTWLTKILINKCYDILRSKSHLSYSEDFPEMGSSGDIDTPMDVSYALHKLSCEDQIILSLFYYDGFSTKEISEILLLSQGVVRTRLTRSRKRFKELYQEEKGVIYEK